MDWQEPCEIQQGQMACTYPFQCQRLETACSGVTLWKRPWRVSRMERAGELFIWGKAEGSGLVHREEDMASGVIMAALQVPWGCYGVDGARLFTVVQGRRMWDKRHKLKEESRRVAIRKCFFFTRRNRKWNRLLREPVWSLSLEVFQVLLDRAWSNPIWS